jgi:hypothetical protein
MLIIYYFCFLTKNFFMHVIYLVWLIKIFLFSFVIEDGLSLADKFDDTSKKIVWLYSSFIFILKIYKYILV